jgi:hypothetical protein
MTIFLEPLDSPERGLSGAQRLLSGTVIKAALLLGLIVYGIGFAILCPLTQASASKSAAEGNDPMLLIGL